MSDEIKKYLIDIYESILFIEKEIGKERIFNNYKNNALLKAAVERKIEIIGEALNRCMRYAPEIPITNKEKIVGTRNRIIHAYDAVDDIMMWEIIINHLPLLRTEVENLLDS